jgi:aspartate kinase
MQSSLHSVIQAPGAIPVDSPEPKAERIVCKFGGTSLADAGQIAKVAAIVRSDKRRRFVVVSAPGKRHRDDQKVTDLLLASYQMASAHLSYAEPLGIIRERYNQIARELDVAFLEEPLGELETELEKLADGKASLATRDWVAARGEYFHARLIADYLGADFVPAGECIIFDDEGRLNPLSYEGLAGRMMREDGLYVVPGFYGRDAQGRIKTFPRGGSDITGAVVARAVEAKVYENWTDVSGLLMADPRVVENPLPISEVTYRELRELSYMGASVLHEETIFPASEAGIPINIRNTNAPDDPGTWIVPSRQDTQPLVGIAGRSGFTMIYIEKALMNTKLGFGRRALEVFEAHRVSWEHMPSAIDSMSIIVADEELQDENGGDKLPAILRELKRTLEPDRLETEKELAMIATVGQGMAHRVGVAGDLFIALKEAQVNVRMISQGASEINIIVGIAADDYQRAVKAIYQAFVERK